MGVLVFSAVENDGRVHLFSRRLEEQDSVKMEGTDGAVGPAFSPDGAWVAFWSDGELKKVILEGGLPVPLCKTPLTFGTSWGPNDVIALARESGGLWQVPASGGEPEPLTTLAPERGEHSHRLPHFLPNGQGLLFTAMKSAESEVVLLDLATGERQVLVPGGADARYAASGHVLYARESVLLAMPFDLVQMEVRGTATPTLSAVMQAIDSTNTRIETAAAQFSFSTDGTMVYAEGGVHPTEERRLLWLDRTGGEVPAELPPGPWSRPRHSSDGSFVSLENAYSAIWVHDLRRGTASRLTYEGAAQDPLWSPDGAQLVFLWEPGDSPAGIFAQAADASGSPKRLSTGPHHPSSWSTDGASIAFVSDGDLWTLSMRDLGIRTVTETPFSETQPAFSPDGKWLAYRSDQSGRDEVYVRAFPGPGAEYQISTAGGHSPAWARTGRELFYLRLDPTAGRYAHDFMAVEISSSPEFSASRPHRLIRRPVSTTSLVRNYDVSADGRFLILTPYDPPTEKVTEIQVVLNWFEELKRLAPVKN